MTTEELLNKIPTKEWELKINHGTSELEYDFLCFIDNYNAVLKYVPKDFTIVDLGCYQAAQCYMFDHYAQYVGVDNFDRKSSVRYIPPYRFMTANTIHIVSSIEDFLNSVDFSVMNLDKTYFIMSAVPAFDETEHAFSKVKNCLWAYPGEEPKTKGIFAEEIKKELWTA